MSDLPEVRARFLAALAAPKGAQLDASAASEEFRRTLLDFASETPDNLACAAQIEIGAVDDETGIKLRNTNALFGDLAHALEEMPTPTVVLERFPGLTDQEWQAFTRVTTLIYTALAQRTKPSAPD